MQFRKFGELFGPDFKKQLAVVSPSGPVLHRSLGNTLSQSFSSCNTRDRVRGLNGIAQNLFSHRPKDVSGRVRSVGKEGGTLCDYQSG